WAAGGIEGDRGVGRRRQPRDRDEALAGEVLRRGEIAVGIGAEGRNAEEGLKVVDGAQVDGAADIGGLADLPLAVGASDLSIAAVLHAVLARGQVEGGDAAAEAECEVR